MSQACRLGSAARRPQLHIPQGAQSIPHRPLRGPGREGEMGLCPVMLGGQRRCLLSATPGTEAMGQAGRGHCVLTGFETLSPSCWGLLFLLVAWDFHCRAHSWAPCPNVAHGRADPTHSGRQLWRLALPPAPLKPQPRLRLDFGNRDCNSVQIKPSSSQAALRSFLFFPFEIIRSHPSTHWGKEPPQGHW